MRRESLVFVLGLSAVLVPFLGVPSSWKYAAMVLVGLILMLLGYQLRHHAYLRSIEHAHGERRAEAYVETLTAVEEDDIKPRRIRAKRV